MLIPVIYTSILKKTTIESDIFRLFCSLADFSLFLVLK